MNVGLLEVAETNNILTLFPQLIDRNGTRGCWDTEGYDGDNFGNVFVMFTFTVSRCFFFICWIALFIPTETFQIGDQKKNYMHM